MSRAAAEVGSTANSYQILAKLASGGMADIFLARGEGVAGVERYCVLKRVLRERASDVHFVQMFLDEARLAAQLQHPNIAQVYDIGKLGDSYFFTMEYVHGETVRALLHRAQGLRRPLPIPCVLTIVAGAAAGLHHAHVRVGVDGRALGIVHRDVSPSNLMVSYEGGVKLVDFGVAKASDRATETKSGTVKGKISYLSPEQCRGKRVDRRSDLFSLGICLWEMLTTDRLYRRASDFENMNAIVSEPPPAPSQRRPDVPPEIDRLVLRLLAKDADERYQTADEVVEAIEAVAAGTGVVLSASALGRLVRELFGQRPEPWLELDAQHEHGEPVTVTSEPIPPELAIAPADRIQNQLAGVIDLSAPRAVTESLDLADVSSIKPARAASPPLPPLPGLPGVKRSPPEKPGETLSLKPLAASVRAAGTRPPETLSLSAKDLAPGAATRPPETLSLSAKDLLERPAPMTRDAGAATALDAAAAQPAVALAAMVSPLSRPPDPAPPELDAPPVGEPTAPLGKPMKRGFPLAAPPPTQPGVAPGSADASSPSLASASGAMPAVRATGPSPNVPVPPSRSTGSSPVVRAIGAPAPSPQGGDTFTEPDPTALPEPPLPPSGAWAAPGSTPEAITALDPPSGAAEASGPAAASRGDAGRPVSTGAANPASPARSAASSGPFSAMAASGSFAAAASSGVFAPAAPGTLASGPAGASAQAASSGPIAVAPSGSFAPQPTLAPAQSASFAAQRAAPAVAHARAVAAHRRRARRPGWPLYAVIVGAAILGSAVVIVAMRSGSEAAQVAGPVTASPAAAAPPATADHRAPIVEPIETEGSAVAVPGAPPAAQGPSAPSVPAAVPATVPAAETPAPSPAGSTKAAGPVAHGALTAHPDKREAAVHGADRRDPARAADRRDPAAPHATTDDVARLYAAGQYDKVVAQCGFGPITAERAPLCFLAACHAGDEAAARRLFGVVPAARREPLASNCKQLGVDVKKPDCDADPMACQH